MDAGWPPTADVRQVYRVFSRINGSVVGIPPSRTARRGEALTACV